MTGYLSPAWFKVTDLQVVKGNGAWIDTADGQKYLDFTSGIAVTSTGHCHPKVVKAIQDQAESFIHAQINCYTHNLLQPLVDELESISPKGIDTFFFANSGAEATEAAVKLAKQATGKPNTIVFSGSFHGRSHMAMAMTTSKTLYRKGYQPLPAGIFVAEFPRSIGSEQEREEAIDRALAQLDYLLMSQTSPDETSCMIIEPEQGEGGYSPAPKRFLDGVLKRCRDNGILFIADEVQSGFGRTGKFFCVENYDLVPDVLVMAKGIASGFPFAAVGAPKEIMDKWPSGSHGSTYGANPIGCAAALATIEVMKEKGFLTNVLERGEQLRAGLSSLAQKYPSIADVRGFGLMVAAEFRDADFNPDGQICAEVIKHAREQSNVLFMSASAYGNVIRFMPPLIVSKQEIQIALDAIESALGACS